MLPVLSLFFSLRFEVRNVMRDDVDLHVYSDPVCVMASSPWLYGSFITTCAAVGGAIMVKYNETYQLLIEVLKAL